ncbi:MAG: DUF4430 domain-containing protein [Clostridia bacterium]|nr:DUF4430 domain-containing protein [Clostridia bacterium]
MKKTLLKKVLSLFVCIVLIAAMALITSGCDNKSTESGVGTFKESEGKTPTTQAIKIDDSKKTFNFTAVDADGNERDYLVVTNMTFVGEALLEAGLISGEDAQYGLYVKTVDGVTLDFDKDGMYWAFYIDGEYAMTGVDSTEIIAGETYTLKAEK